jgi:GNAT superfamily N-acetyltransferase
MSNVLSKIEYASYETTHKDDYLGLLEEAWRDDAMSRAEFEWWFERNPAGSLMSVARTNGRVVGVAAHSLYRAVLESEEQLVSFSVHATTHASARGRGVFQELERKHEREAQERGVACVLAFASAPTAPLFLGPLGWTEVGRLRIWARPVLRAGAQPKLRPTVARFDTLGDAAAEWPNHLVRDAQYLNWRYLESPRDYVAVQRGEDYAVLGHKVHKGRRIALIADLVTRRPRALLRECVRRVRPGTRLLFALPAPDERSTYAVAGFAPTPMTLQFVGKPLAGKLNPDPHAWRFTLGDTDFF